MQDGAPDPGAFPRPLLQIQSLRTHASMSLSGGSAASPRSEGDCSSPPYAEPKL